MVARACISAGVAGTLPGRGLSLRLSQSFIASPEVMRDLAPGADQPHPADCGRRDARGEHEVQRVLRVHDRSLVESGHGPAPRHVARMAATGTGTSRRCGLVCAACRYASQKANASRHDLCSTTVMLLPSQSRSTTRWVDSWNRNLSQ